MLASAYAAAGVFVLPSKGEVFPLTVLEALAAGTPVMMSSESALSLPDSGAALVKVRWDDVSAQKRALIKLLDAPPERNQVRALVRSYTWDSVARRVATVYEDVLTATRGNALPQFAASA